MARRVLHVWNRRQGGFTYLEVLLAGAIIGVAISALGVLLGTLAHSRQALMNRSQAEGLAQSLLQEVLTRDYADPDGGTGWGLDSDESAAYRTTFDDVDDFDGYSQSPPTAPDGSALDGFEDYGWSVEVGWAPTSGKLEKSITDTDIKLILVEVTQDGVVAAEAQGLKAAPNEGS